MTAVRLPLDMAGVYAVTLREVPAGIEVSLEAPPGDRRSSTHDAFVRQLRVRDGAVLRPLDARTHSVRAHAESVEIFVVEDAGPPLSLATISVSDAGVRAATHWRLSPFELRYAADTGVLHPVPLAARAAKNVRLPVTDLHTHFAGCIRGEDLVELGAEQGIVYPRALFDLAKIRAESDVALADLAPHLRARLAERLSVPIDRRVTFQEMERVYRLRSPLTKARSMLVPICRRIAADYAAMGVEYVELSLGSVVFADVLRTIHRELPAIEAESGVRMRFLAAISRHDDPEWDLDLVERIKMLAGSVYLVGVDFMGHETNSTRVFAPILGAIARWADQVRPGFVVRVHAGESPSHPENVRVALEETHGHRVELRIGHGLYGVDPRTLDEIVRSEATVEFNLDSNVALNHLQSARAVPLRRYVEAGARVVLGTDGYGIYGGSPSASVQAALLAGLDGEHLGGALAAVERSCLERARERDARVGREPFVVPDDPPPVHFTPRVIDRRRAEIAARDAALAARLEEVRVPLLEADGLEAELGGRMLVSIAGAWARSWEGMSNDERDIVTREMTAFIGGLDPEEAVLVTGGTRFGVEGLVGRCAIEAGLTVVAAIVRATPPAGLDRAAMTHACVVGEDFYDKAAGLYELVASHAGVCLFVAGGQIVSDEIQTARNLRLRYLLMDGVGGASSRHAAEQPARAFRRADEALHAIRGWRVMTADHAPHWYDGPNPTVDAVVLRRQSTGYEVLLVLRDLDAPADAGKWALPGGFIASSAARGGAWASGSESEVDACVRELREETGLVVASSELVRLGVYEGGGRDPRDTARSWSRSTAFVVVLDEAAARAGLAGGDDAADARWFGEGELPSNLAFDHAQILVDALARARGASRS